MKRVIFLAVVLLMVFAALPVSADNGAPNGAHYNLNIIGVANPKTADMDGANGHGIFVPEYGGAQDLAVAFGMSSDFQVTDANGMDDNGAAFTLPLPGECYGTQVTPSQADIMTPDTCTIRYTVWMRLLGKPGGNMAMYTCIERSGRPGGSICSDPDWWVELTRNKGKSRSPT